MQVVAHRGATEHAAENTLEAFRAARELGADAIEMDVRLSADGVAVVYHYAYLEGGTDGRGPVWQHSLRELRELRVGGLESARIPTLSEVLEEFSPAPAPAPVLSEHLLRLEIELKGPEPKLST